MSEPLLTVEKLCWNTQRPRQNGAVGRCAAQRRYDSQEPLRIKFGRI
jgi:hypothetical protein